LVNTEKIENVKEFFISLAYWAETQLAQLNPLCFSLSCGPASSGVAHHRGPVASAGPCHPYLHLGVFTTEGIFPHHVLHKISSNLNQKQV
jgi:hypothetical protein